MLARAIFYVLVIAMFCGPVRSAQEKLQGWCQYGGQTVTVSGVSSSDTWQASYPSCTVTVYDTGTLNLSTIYSDEGVTPKANPFTADTTGYWFAYAADGDYDVKFSGGGIPAPFTLTDFKLYSAGAGISSLGGLTGATQTFADDTNVTMSSAGTTHTLGWTGDLSVDRGGTGASTFTDNGVLLGNVAAALQVTAAGAAYQPFRVPSGGGAPAFGALDISQSAAVTGALAIANGGSGVATSLAAFNAFSPLTTKGDVLGFDSSNNVRLAVGTDGQCLQANSATSSGLGWASCLGASPLTVPNGGTGAATLTGSVIGNGTAAMTAVAASAQLDLLRRQPNQTATTYHYNAPHYVVSSDFDFPSQQPGGTLTAAVGATPTMTPCPLGVNGADSSHYLYISGGGGGAAEAVLITGGTCTSGAATGTIGFTPANNHTGAWALTSATSGIQEAICYLPSGNNRVIVPQGTSTLNSAVSWCGETDAELFISNNAVLAGSGALPTPDYDDLNLFDNRSQIKVNNGTFPICQKLTVASTNAAFIVASTTATVTLFQLPARGKVTGVTIKHSAQYSDNGGAMSAVTVSVGSPGGGATQYTATQGIGEATAVADTTFLDTDTFESYTHAAENVNGYFTATGRNFGDGAVTFLTGGSVDCWICWVQLP
jgi:hypothetical protein